MDFRALVYRQRTGQTSLSIVVPGTTGLSCQPSTVRMVNIYYSTIDEETGKVLANLFHFHLHTQKQVGGNDCGLFAIAIATAIADPTKVH